jgi:predicted TIM-barrel fold metal-dependent hydrolase
LIVLLGENELLETENMKKTPWIHVGKRSDREVPYETPIELGDKSNGEFFHEQTHHERRLKKLILEKCDEKARYVGMDRRDFIASTMGMATTLSVLNMAAGCGSNEDGTSDNPTDGGYHVPGECTVDMEAANALLSGDEFILDMQTHHIEDEVHWRESHPGRTYNGNAIASFLTFYSCPEIMTNPIECVDSDHYVDAIFMNSDTTVAVLSGFPGPICDDTTLCDHPISNEDMVNSRDRINAAAGSQRMVQHCQVMPDDRWELQAQAMERINREHGNHGWKVYPPSGGWWLDDPAIAYPMYEKALELKQPIICAHKGLLLGAFIEEFLDPKDVGPAAKDWPFVVYHSAIELGRAEGEYSPNTPTAELQGVDRLIRTVEEHGLGGKNVYAEMGTAWFVSMNDPVAAQHYVGKVLKYLGEDRMVWGSECVWFNSPQPQIETFRTFQISEEFQQRYGYPAITDEIRRKIFGLNAARLYDIDPTEARCTVDKSKIAQVRRDIDGELGGRRWMFQPLRGPRTRREFVNFWRWKEFSKTPV